MDKLKIGPRLALAFGAILLITAKIALICVTPLGALKDTAQSIASREMGHGSPAQSWSAYTNLNRVRITTLLKTAGIAIADAPSPNMAQTSTLTIETQRKLLA